MPGKGLYVKETAKEGDTEWAWRHREDFLVGSREGQELSGGVETGTLAFLALLR